MATVVPSRWHENRPLSVLEPTHTVAGNPNRHSSGRTRLALDDEWRRRMPWRDRALGPVSLLRRYEYRVGGPVDRG
ncbi:MAG: hypothetical protein ACRCSN_11375 [Dermatophilaceae bacterium]